MDDQRGVLGQTRVVRMSHEEVMRMLERDAVTRLHEQVAKLHVTNEGIMILVDQLRAEVLKLKAKTKAQRLELRRLNHTQRLIWDGVRFAQQLNAEKRDK